MVDEYSIGFKICLKIFQLFWCVLPEPDDPEDPDWREDEFSEKADAKFTATELLGRLLELHSIMGYYDG